MHILESITALALSLTPLKKHALGVVLIILAVLVFLGPASAANLVLTPTNLSFVAVQGTNPAAQTVNAYPSIAGTTITPTFSSSVNWIVLSGAAAGSLTSSSNVFVSVNTLGLVPGFYNGQVTIAQAGYTKSPQVVGVTLQVLAPGISYVAS